MFTLPNTNDGHYHNNKENHEMLSMIQSAYTPIEFDNENNTFTANNLIFVGILCFTIYNVYIGFKIRILQMETDLK